MENEPKQPKAAKKAAKKRALRKSPRPFPSVSLEVALKIPQLIKANNGGKPWPPAEVAKALGSTAKSNKMWYVSSSARDYGLTVGTRDTEKIELTELGREIVYAPSRQEEVAGIQKAFFNVEVFKKVYDHYEGGNLPEVKYLENTLENEFGVSPEHHDEFHKIFGANKSYIESFPEIVSGSLTRLSGDTSLSSSHAIIVGQPSNNTELKAFVAMPFSEKTGKYPVGFYSEVLKALITPAGVDAGFKVETARKDGSDIIHSTIVNDLLDADLVIADLSDHNPNVLFELGLRMAHDKPIAIIRAKGTAPIFDVDHLLRVFEYAPNLWRSTIERDLPDLTDHIKGAWENRNNGKTFMKILREENRV